MIVYLSEKYVKEEREEVVADINVNQVFDVLFRTIEDYSVDKRGDIGSVVRE